uniref:perilipin-2 isoform X2 n=1 Tax=Ciona intestinalis TaxID=7719 RepID=UPI00006A5634|nr:perilipin-2 isoform X2 [Ciona intestinalis]|eukprot:XP_002122513.1 perilipin-2 isoform X2 [Ciona intestinalis]
MCDTEETNIYGEKLSDVLGHSEEHDVDIADDDMLQDNALNRVASLPIVASTWNAMQSYYATVKKTYPNVSPYLEAAENLTVSAANLALETSRPVVDRFGNTVNSYANKGLDTLESKVPIITKEPEEMYNITKSTATSLINNKVEGALEVTERYVEYYLPKDEDEVVEELDSDLSQEEDEEGEENDPEAKKQPSDRIREISNKVRQRSYKRAMRKLHGVQTRSKEALSKLSFTVDLIQYAQSGLNSTSAGIMDSANRANESVQNGMNVAKSNLQVVTDSINKQVEENVLNRARILSRQLSDTCQWSIRYIQNSPQLQPLLKKANQVKDASDDLYQMFANKTSLSQLPTTLMVSARPKIQFVEESLLQILQKMSDQPPIAWLLAKSQSQEAQSANKDEKSEEKEVAEEE